MKYSMLIKSRLIAIGKSQSIFRSFSKGQSTKAKISPFSLSRESRGRLSLLGNKDHDGRWTRGRLSVDVKASPEISVVISRPAARNALCIEAITAGQCPAYINKFRASLSP
jgi:hypothetical protein